MLPSFDFQLRTRVVFGQGSFSRLGELARELGFRRTLIVSDRGLLAAGYVGEARQYLSTAGVETFAFHDFEVNPNSTMIEIGRDFAQPLDIDSIIGLGGGSSMDCAKGINFILTNGGRIQDYWGYAKATRPMLPMIAVPTTAGTGSEAQSYALISDADTHVKMACGDPKIAFRVALLDPDLTVSQPAGITASAGFDAIAHAVETYVTTRRNPISEVFSREAWRLLGTNFERVIEDAGDVEARAGMQLGAFFAGAAIENSMLGATHACANPLTANYGTGHGDAIATLLPSVIRWNSPVVEARYGELMAVSGQSFHGNPAEGLAARLEYLRSLCGLPASLSDMGISWTELERLSTEAAGQWTGSFNPRPFDAAGALEVYKWAF